MVGRIGGQEKGTTEYEMAGWHHWLDGHEFGWTLGVVDGHGGLACCSSWSCKKLDITEWLDWTEWSRGFPHFRQFKSEFGNKEFTIWATVSSHGRKEYNQSDFGVDNLVMSMCRVFFCIVRRWCFLWPVHSFGKTLLVFALLHSVIQGQIWLLAQVFLYFLLLNSSHL